MKAQSSASQQENPLLNLVINVILPVVILSKFSTKEWLGPVYGLVAAVALPLGYGLYDLIRYKKYNFMSILGLISVSLTGVLGLLKLDPFWIAVKEAAVPLVIGLALIISLKTPFPLVEKLLFNERLLNLERIEAALAERHKSKADLKQLLSRATYLLACSFLLSAILNWVLARMIVVSQPGTEAFTEELGKMQGLSFPVIALPSTVITMLALYYLINGLKKLTHLSTTDMLNIPEDKK